MHRATLGEALEVGDIVHTDDLARVALSLPGGQSLRLDHSTQVRLLSASSLALDRGATYVDSGLENTSPVEVTTSLGLVRDIGTQFEIRQLDERLVVRVREGTVVVNHQEQELNIPEGSALTLADGIPPKRTNTTPFDTSWGWVQEIAPAFDIDGRPTTDFLSWVARESGLTVRFASAAAEDLADTAILHGSAVGLAPAQALTFVLPGSGLSHQIDEGILTVTVR